MARPTRSGDISQRSSHTERSFDCSDLRYREWREEAISTRFGSLRMATKPGLHFSRELDPSTALLLDYLDADGAGSAALLDSGSGIVAAAIAVQARSASLHLADRSVVSVEASRRTLEANGVANAKVLHSQGLPHLPDSTLDLVAIRIPQGKLPTIQLLRDAHRLLRPGGRCWVAGGNDEGAKTALRQMEELFGNALLLGYRGGHRVGVATRLEGAGVIPAELEIPWVDPERFHDFTVGTPAGPLQIRARPGVFSWDRLDRGSESLVGAMEVREKDEVVEFGSGYGLIGTLAARMGALRVTMLDVDVEAVQSSSRTAAANGVAGRCEVIPSDIASAVLDRRFDLVLTNPPFHVGKATDLEVPAQFIRDAAAVLRPGGRLLLVANRTLPYERWIERCFGSVQTVVDGREFKVLGAIKPS